jgi:hypothetical protein
MIAQMAAGFIAPCLPTKTAKLPSGSQWLHEIKHDGFRIIARNDGQRVRLYSRPGNDFTRHFALMHHRWGGGCFATTKNRGETRQSVPGLRLRVERLPRRQEYLEHQIRHEEGPVRRK